MESETRISGCRAAVKNTIIKQKLLPYRCSISGCGILGEWLGNSISLHLDHIDGDPDNNTLSNLRFLCPNCHSQTRTYCRAKRKHSCLYQSIEHKILENLDDHSSVRSLLESIGQTDQGSNYNRIHKVFSRNFSDTRVTKFLDRCKLARFKISGSSRRVHTRKVEWPSADKLRELISTVSIVEIGKRYGITDNSVRKWCDHYGINVKELSPFSHSSKKNGKIITLCESCGKPNKRSTNRFCSYRCSILASRKVPRPTKESLEEDIKKIPILDIAKNNGVTHSTVRKWCNAYGIDHKSISPFSHKLP